MATSNLDYIHPVLQKELPLFTTIDDVSDGIIGMLRNPKLYLIQEPQETDDSYASRLQKATWIDAFSDTIDGLNGLVFKKDIIWNDLPTKLEPTIENADAQGNHADILIQDFFDIALRKGLSFVLVDMPKAENVENKADEKALGIKPYWTVIQPENVTSWKTETINGQLVLSQVKIREYVEIEVDGNDYATETKEQYRILERGTFKVIRPAETKGEADELISEGETGIDFIPLVALNLGKEGFFSAKPPFYDLATLNIRHYQIFTDSGYSAHIASVPMLKFIGFDEKEIKKMVISANTAIGTSNTEANVEWLDYKGDGVVTNKILLDKLEEQMASMGLAVITGDKEVTATEAQIASDKGQSKLNKYVRSLEDAVGLILQYSAAFFAEKDGGTVTIEADILSKPMTAQELTALSNAVASGSMSIKTMYMIIQSGSFRLGDEFDVEVEISDLSTQGLLGKPTVTE